MEKYSYGEIQVCIGPVSRMYATIEVSNVYMYKIVLSAKTRVHVILDTHKNLEYKYWYLYLKSIQLEP